MNCGYYPSTTKTEKVLHPVAVFILCGITLGLFILALPVMGLIFLKGKLI